MDAEALAARPGVLDEHVGGDVPHLPHDVELAEAVELRAAVGDGVELAPVLVPDLGIGWSQ
jgi:hypothetical protein